jgi:hypothetical protein
MPKDEVDPQDPLELSGMAFLTTEDTSEDMTECFVEEYLRMGHSPAQILSYFRDPFYLAVNMVLENRGEPWVRRKIVEAFARWGRPVEEAALAPANPGSRT